MTRTAERKEIHEGRIKRFLENLMGIRHEDERTLREQLESQGFHDVTDTFGSSLRTLLARGKYLVIYSPKTDQMSEIYERKFDGRNGDGDRPPLELITEVLQDISRYEPTKQQYDARQF